MSLSPTGTGIGQPVRRREDLRLLTGQGRYSDDVNVAGQAYRGDGPFASRACIDPLDRH